MLDCMHGIQALAHQSLGSNVLLSMQTGLALASTAEDESVEIIS